MESGNIFIFGLRDDLCLEVGKIYPNIYTGAVIWLRELCKWFGGSQFVGIDQRDDLNAEEISC